MKSTITQYIYRDYQIIGGVLVKEGLDDNKHLMWSRGFFGIPAIDAKNVWDKFHWLIKNIQITTKKGRVFRVGAEVFDKNKKELDFKYGKQYYIEKKYWNIYDPVKRQRKYQKEIIEKEKLKQTTLL